MPRGRWCRGRHSWSRGDRPRTTEDLRRRRAGGCYRSGGGLQWRCCPRWRRCGTCLTRSWKGRGAALDFGLGRRCRRGRCRRGPCRRGRCRRGARAAAWKGLHRHAADVTLLQLEDVSVLPLHSRSAAGTGSLPRDLVIAGGARGRGAPPSATAPRGDCHARLRNDGARRRAGTCRRCRCHGSICTGDLSLHCGRHAPRRRLWMP
mmetsp:Transcript_122305/g.273110  ORF Transcript_122305/g.273110 Transcript_122305/m.273110 type:complete len:205 (-) Transcript_122305:89-703(-)